MCKCARHHDKRVNGADEEAVLFQGANFGAQLCDRVAQAGFSRGSGSCKRVLSFCAFQFIFGRREIRIRRSRFLWPAITGGRLEVSRRTRASRHAIRIGAVRIHVHVRLEQERFSMALWMLKLQNSLAIEEIMTRQKQIEPG